MDEPEPLFPPSDAQVLRPIIEYAEALAAWLERHQEAAVAHGRDPNSQSELITGWRFVAAALREATQ